MTDSFRSDANKDARDRKKGAHLQALFDRYRGRFRAMIAADAPATAREIHATLDQVVAQDRQQRTDSDGIRCHKGCAFCCHGPVEIWPHEASLLVETAHQSGIAINTARLERQRAYTMETWHQQPAPEQACVFLGDDGACRVYESRPNACRKLFVVTDPSLCDANEHPAESVERWPIWEAEILEAAALEVFGSALMPRSLLAAIERGNKHDSA
jgi:Fe-S-cluster containining protein